MFLDDIKKQLVVSEKVFDVAVKKSEAYTSMAVMEATIATEESDIKIILENGTPEDLEYLYEEAQDGFIGKVKKAIQAIIDAIKKFFSDVKNKIVSLFTKSEVDKGLDNIEKKAKFNPFLKKKKIVVKDTDAEETCIKKYTEKLKKFALRIKSGDDVSNTEMEEAHESFLKEHAKVIAATIGISLIAGIALCRKKLKSANKDTEGPEKEANSMIQSIKDTMDKITNSDAATKLQKIASRIGENSKKLGSAVVSRITGLFSAIKKAKSSGDNLEGDEEFEIIDDEAEEIVNDNSSTYDLLSFFDDSTTSVTESYSDDIFDEFDALFTI